VITETYLFTNWYQQTNACPSPYLQCLADVHDTPLIYTEQVNCQCGASSCTEDDLRGKRADGGMLVIEVQEVGDLVPNPGSSRRRLTTYALKSYLVSPTVC
jgi:hypothetical protein